MERALTEKEQEVVLNCGALGYSEEDIADLLSIDLSDVKINEDNEIARLYRKGKKMAKYRIELKVFELAQQGDLKAMQKYELMLKQKRRNE